MKENELFPSKYIKAEDIDGNLNVIISDAIQEAVGPLKSMKLVLYFTNYPKPFVCNKTNFLKIKKLHGEDTDDWINKKITLFRTTTEFQGEEIPAIRVRDRVVTAAKPSVPVPEEPPMTDEMLASMSF